MPGSAERISRGSQELVSLSRPRRSPRNCEPHPKILRCTMLHSSAQLCPLRVHFGETLERKTSGQRWRLARRSHRPLVQSTTSLPTSASPCFSTLSGTCDPRLFRNLPSSASGVQDKFSPLSDSPPSAFSSSQFHFIRSTKSSPSTYTFSCHAVQPREYPSSVSPLRR